MRWFVMLMLALAMACGAPDDGPAEVYVDTTEAGEVACGTTGRWICRAVPSDVTVHPDHTEMTVYAPTCYPAESTSPCVNMFEHIILEGAADAAAYREVLSQICQEGQAEGRRIRACIGNGFAASLPTQEWQCEPNPYCDNTPPELQHPDRCRDRQCGRFDTCSNGQKLADLQCPAAVVGHPSSVPRHSDAAIAEAIDGACSGADGDGSTTMSTGARVNCP